MADPIRLIGPLLDALKAAIAPLSPQAYAHPIPILHNASIGQHVRHILDMYEMLHRGVATGLVNYEARERDPRVETEPSHAVAVMDRIKAGLRSEDMPLEMAGTYDQAGDEVIRVPSTYFRELLYNFEHTVHHMAIIRIGLNALGRDEPSDDFGVAPSTVKYRRTCAR